LSVSSCLCSSLSFTIVLWTVADVPNGLAESSGPMLWSTEPLCPVLRHCGFGWFEAAGALSPARCGTGPQRDRFSGHRG
jgi:hypothetical protein